MRRMTSRVVPQILPGAALVSSDKRPLGSLAFPAAGNIQVIDAAGNLDYIPTSAAPGDAALLAATQTFTGVNTFAPASGLSRVADAATPLFDVNVVAPHKLTAIAGKLQAGSRITAPVFNKALGDPDSLAQAVTLLISGAPTGTAVGGGTDAYSLAVFSGETLLNGPTSIGNDLTIDGNIRFQGAYTISIPTVPTSATVTVGGLDYAIALGGAGVLKLDAGATGGVQMGFTAGSKIGFYTTTPIVKQTGVAVSAAGVHAALVALGLIAA